MSEIKDTEDKGITYEYKGIVVTYDESWDMWRYELRGRQRSAKSLAKVKESIDRPVKQKNPFRRFEAYYDQGYGNFVLVEITSIAEDEYGRADTVWCWNEKADYQKRFKTNENRIFPRSEHNVPIIRKIDELMEAQGKIVEEIKKLKGKLKHYEVPEDKEADRE